MRRRVRGCGSESAEPEQSDESSSVRFFVAVLLFISPGALTADDDLSVSTQWGRTSHRNNVYAGELPIDWELADNGRMGGGLRWSVEAETRTWPPGGFCAGPAVAGGKVFVGSSSDRVDYLNRHTNSDLALMLCFRESDGEFLWQYNSDRLRTGNAQDWSSNPVAGTPYVDRERLWFVSNRCEVVCLDVEGFADDENDGPFVGESHVAEHEADVVWKLDMIADLRVSPHEMSHCSLTSASDRLFVCTSNGVGPGERTVPAPEAPSFLAVSKLTGEVLWSDNSPGENILDGQWASPACGVLGGVPQVIFAGGDGWVYSFDPDGNGRGDSRLLWKFDCNPKESRREGVRGDRHNIVATPVIHEQRVFVALGEERELGTGQGRLWCIDPTRRGDVSPQLVFNRSDPTRPIAHKRDQACEPDRGDFTRENPNSAAVWCFTGTDLDHDGAIANPETMHGALSSPAISDGLLFIGDDEGIVHCVAVETGEALWNFDAFSVIDGSPLISRNHVYMGTEDGDVLVFECAPGMNLVARHDMLQAVEGTPVAANGVLYITTAYRLFAIDGD